MVHIAYEDAAAYAKWAGKRLPTEAEFEFAARGGLTGKPYAWGDELKPGGKWPANIYQGKFPVKGGDAGEDGFKGIAPVAQFRPNGYGLFDVGGKFGSGPATGIARTTIQPWPNKAASRAIRRDHHAALIQPNLINRNECNVVVRSSAPMSIAPATWSGRVAKAKCAPASNHLGFRCVKDVKAG